MWINGKPSTIAEIQYVVVMEVTVEDALLSRRG
jgi:hypothetical protein